MNLPNCADIRLVVSDVDNTLYRKQVPVPDELPAIVRACRARGIAFGLATGRTRELADRFMKQLQLTDPSVLANGAIIVQGERCIYKRGFQVGRIRDIIRRACDDGLTVTISDEKEERPVVFTPYILEQQRLKNRFWNRIDLDSPELENGEFVKLMIFDPEKTGKIRPYQQELQRYRDYYWVTSFSNQAVELGPKDCNKATGVRELARILGLEMSNVMAIGDFVNDLEMIQQAGIGVAVANASDEIKANADYVTNEPLGYGVIEALRKFCL